MTAAAGRRADPSGGRRRHYRRSLPQGEGRGEGHRCPSCRRHDRSSFSPGLHSHGCQHSLSCPYCCCLTSRTKNSPRPPCHRTRTRPHAWNRPRTWTPSRACRRGVRRSRPRCLRSPRRPARPWIRPSPARGPWM